MRIESFLKCIGRCILDSPEKPEDGWSLWMQYHLEAFCYYYFHEQLPASERESFRLEFNHASARSLQLEHQWQLLKGLLLHAGIRFCPIKGVDLAFRVYPHPALRPMGDFDLLIHPEDCAKAWQLVRENGWSTPVNYPHCHHFPMLHKGAFALELHFKLPGLPTVPPGEVFITRDAEGVYRLPLGWNLILLFAHAMNHRWQNGMRMLLDMSFLLKGREWPTQEINALCVKWHLPNPELIRAAFPELFGITSDHKYSDEMITDFRNTIMQAQEWRLHEYEILMTGSKRFSFSWIRQRIRGCSIKVVRRKYGIYQGQYAKVLYYYGKDLAAKLKILWRYRHGSDNAELRAYVQRLERIQNYLQH